MSLCLGGLDGNAPRKLRSSQRAYGESAVSYITILCGFSGRAVQYCAAVGLCPGPGVPPSPKRIDK